MTFIAIVYATNTESKNILLFIYAMHTYKYGFSIINDLILSCCCKKSEYKVIEEEEEWRRPASTKTLCTSRLNQSQMVS